MKYAVIEAGGKQYLAREGETLEVDRMPVEVGQKVEFKEVLLFAEDGKVQVGAPQVKGAKVEATVVAQIKAPKIIVFKYIPKERYRRKRGHRQQYTRVRVDRIAVAKPRAKKASEAEKPKAAGGKKQPAAKGAKAGTKSAASKKQTKKPAGGE